MSVFTDKETEYLRGQRLGRIATVGAGGSPHAVPVTFRLDADADSIEVGGRGLSASKKWRDLTANPRVAFVVDDLASVNPWSPRGVEVRGHARLHQEGGERFGPGAWDSVWIQVVPERIVSWGLEEQRSARSVGSS